MTKGKMITDTIEDVLKSNIVLYSVSTETIIKISIEVLGKLYQNGLID